MRSALQMICSAPRTLSYLGYCEHTFRGFSSRPGIGLPSLFRSLSHPRSGTSRSPNVTGRVKARGLRVRVAMHLLIYLVACPQDIEATTVAARCQNLVLIMRESKFCHVRRAIYDLIITLSTSTRGHSSDLSFSAREYYVRCSMRQCPQSHTSLLSRHNCIQPSITNIIAPVPHSCSSLTQA